MNRWSILIVDDESITALSLADVLSSDEVEVLTASNLEEAGRLVRTRSFDVVITDLQLTTTGRLEGLAMISSVKETAPSTSVVLLTAHRTDEIEREALRRGATACWSKAMAPEHIVRELVLLGMPANPSDRSVQEPGLRGPR